MTTNPLAHTNHSKQRMQQRAISQQGLQAATLYGDRFVLPDGTVLQLVTRQAAARIVRELGLRPGFVDESLRGVYVVMARNGAMLTCGRRWAGRQGRIHRS